MATPITIADLTLATLDGTGVFDVLMRSVKTHVAVEYDSQRIKGAEYAQVYLGALQSTMDRSLQFLLARDKLTLELGLLEIEKEKLLIEKDIAGQQLLVMEQSVLESIEKVALMKGQVLQTVAETARINEDIGRVTAQKDLLAQQALNAIVENDVLTQTACKLKAEFDLITQQVAKSAAETGLLNQKKVTEAAQTSSAGVDANSVVGKQVGLYAAQTQGFYRADEQKAAKIMVDTWNVRRTTDEGTLADDQNGLFDPNIGRVINKLLAGISA